MDERNKKKYILRNCVTTCKIPFSFRPSRSPIVKKHYTPKRQQADLSGIPKYCTPPRLNSSLDMNRHQQQSPQYLNKSLTGCQRYSPIRAKSVEKKLRSPLKDNNKIFTKVKPLKLVSALIFYKSTTNSLN